jgi:hypothetical protein
MLYEVKVTSSNLPPPSPLCGHKKKKKKKKNCHFSNFQDVEYIVEYIIESGRRERREKRDSGNI